MLFDSKSVVTGMSSHPGTRCLLPSVDVARLRAERRSVHYPSITLRATAQIPYSAEEPYGDEFRPD